MNLLEMINSVPHWYHRFQFAPGVITPGINNSEKVLLQLDLPRDLSGLRVLDIGARDGFFSFECERRGAEVVAIDYCPPQETGFPMAKQILGSKLDLIHENVYRLTPAQYGTFDIVLCLGVLYHLPDPMLALDIIHEMMKPGATLYLETVMIDSELPPELTKQPLMEFYPKGTKNNDHTNYWGMTEQCVIDMLAENRLSCLETRGNAENRALFVACKTSPEKNYYLRISRSLVDGPKG